MSELKEFDVGLGQYCEDGSPCVVAFDSDKNPRLLNEKVYLKSEVDAAIAELKKKCEAEKSIGATFSKNGADLARWVEELRKEIESLKATAYAESVDAGMRERKMKRALWLARAEIAKAMKAIENLDNYLSLHKNSKLFGIYATRIDTWYYKWENVERKCRAKADEFGG